MTFITSFMTVLDEKSTFDFDELFLDESKALAFAYEYDLLFDGDVCDAIKGCKGNYIISKDVAAKTGYILMCSHCRKKRSVFYNSIFTRAKIEVRQAHAISRHMNAEFQLLVLPIFFKHLGKHAVFGLKIWTKFK